MTKEEQFLFLVQTIVLANGINLSSQVELASRYRHVYSATGVLGLMQDAIYASTKIPERMSAFDAAHEFCGYMLSNLRDAQEAAEGQKMTVPGWFARS